MKWFESLPVELMTMILEYHTSDVLFETCYVLSQHMRRMVILSACSRGDEKSIAFQRQFFTKANLTHEDEDFLAYLSAHENFLAITASTLSNAQHKLSALLFMAKLKAVQQTVSFPFIDALVRDIREHTRFHQVTPVLLTLTDSVAQKLFVLRVVPALIDKMNVDCPNTRKAAREHLVELFPKMDVAYQPIVIKALIPLLMARFRHKHEIFYRDGKLILEDIFPLVAPKHQHLFMKEVFPLLFQQLNAACQETRFLAVEALELLFPHINRVYQKLFIRSFFPYYLDKLSVRETHDIDEVIYLLRLAFTYIYPESEALFSRTLLSVFLKYRDKPGTFLYQVLIDTLLYLFLKVPEAAQALLIQFFIPELFRSRDIYDFLIEVFPDVCTKNQAALLQVVIPKVLLKLDSTSEKTRENALNLLSFFVMRSEVAYGMVKQDLKARPLSSMGVEGHTLQLILNAYQQTYLKTTLSVGFFNSTDELAEEGVRERSYSV